MLTPGWGAPEIFFGRGHGSLVALRRCAQSVLRCPAKTRRFGVWTSMRATAWKARVVPATSQGTRE